MLQQDLNKLVNSYDRFNDDRKNVTGLGISNHIEIFSSTRLREISDAAGKKIRRTKTAEGIPMLKVEYRGICFFHIAKSNDDQDAIAA